MGGGWKRGRDFVWVLLALALVPSWSRAAGSTPAPADSSQRPAVEVIPTPPTGPLAESEHDRLNPSPATPPSSAATPAAPTAASAKLARASASDADSSVLNAPAVEDIELQMNADVLKYIEFFTGAGRSTFERWMKRSGRYMELFRTVLQREGLPPDLVHLVYVESGFNLNARSVSAAVGPWQFMRSSARLFGL